MKISMAKNELIKCLSRVQGIVERRNTLPILSYVLVKAEGSSIEVTSTDLEIGMRAEYPAKVEEPGVITIMAKKAFEIARELTEEDVEIKSEENSWVKLSSGKANFRMVGLPKEDFPELPRHTIKDGFAIHRKTLIEMISKTVFAISHDQTRYALNGVLFEATTAEEGAKQICRMVATDGHRLAMVEKACVKGNHEDKSVIIPRKAVVELKKVLEDEEGEDIRMELQENHAFFMGAKIVLAVRLIDGQFPEYQQVIPKESRRVAAIGREEFGQVLKRISILTADRSNPVRFSFSADKMTVSTNNPEIGEASETMSVAYDKEAIDLGFNARYLMDFISVVEEENILMKMNEPLSPGLMMTENDKGYRYVIMPMRL